MTLHTAYRVALSLVFLAMMSSKLPLSAEEPTTPQQIILQVKQQCKVDGTTTDRKKLEKQARCMAKHIRAFREQALETQMLERAANTYSLMTLPPATVPAPSPGNQPGSQPPGKDAAKAGAAQTDLPALPYVGGSASATPTTCGTGGTGSVSSSLLRIHRQVTTPNTAMDDFGNRLGKRFVVYQVTVENLSGDYQYKLEDISVDFSPTIDTRDANGKLVPTPPGTYRFAASGQDLTLLRGVPEKGQDYDPRNLSLHILQGIGSVAAAVTGLTPFSDAMGGAIAQFNGPFINSYTSVLPDHTATQLNRLSDSAFIANTIINKKDSKTIVLFIPMDEVMSSLEKKDFLKDPYTLAALDTDSNSNKLYKADICVDGTFIEPITISPGITSATVSAGSVAGKLYTITVVGSNLVQGDSMLILGSGSTSTKADLLSTDGTHGSAQIVLPSDYVAGKTQATVGSKSNPSASAKAVTLVEGLSLTSATLPAKPEAGKTAVLTLVGSGLTKGDTQVLVNFGSSSLTQPVTVTDDRNGTASIMLPTLFDLATTTAVLSSKSSPSVATGTPVQVVAAAATSTALKLTSATVPSASKAGREAIITIVGENMQQGDTHLVVGSGKTKQSGNVTTTDGKSGTARLKLPTDFAAGTTTAVLQFKSDKKVDSGTPVTVTAAP